MAQDGKLQETKLGNKPNKHWVLWSLVSAFIVLFIVGMLVVDSYYAPDASKVSDSIEN
jgi:hypothetical protein